MPISDDFMSVKNLRVPIFFFPGKEKAASNSGLRGLWYFF